MRKIVFKSMKEGRGNYSISNEGHIRSHIGKSKILKLDSRYSYPGVIGLSVSCGVRQKFSVYGLMEKYWPDVILKNPNRRRVSKYCVEKKSLQFLLEEISKICGFTIKYNKVTTKNIKLKEYIERATKMLTEDERLRLFKY